MNYLARVRGLVDLPIDTQRDLLLALTRHNSAFESVALLDPAGGVIAAGSGFPLGAVDASTRSPALLQTVAEGDDFLGSAEIDPTLNSPVLVVALPARDRNNQRSRSSASSMRCGSVAAISRPRRACCACRARR